MFKKITYSLLVLIVLILTIGFVAGSFFSRVKDKESLVADFVKESASLNSLGFRDIEHDLTKKNGLFRITVLGDSQTYGQSISE